jgi:hypothetical protein
LKLHGREGFQISLKTGEDCSDGTSGILSKAFEIALIIPIRFAYETATFDVSPL